MSERAGILEVLAIRVADGVAIDWDAMFRTVMDKRERDIISSLRALESVARVHGVSSASNANPASPSETSAGLDATATLDVPNAQTRADLRTTWAHLEVRGKLGEGGFAEVYRAWDPRLDREVALKLLKPGPSPTKANASRVIEEGRLLARFRHPNVVTVFGAEVHEGRVGLWMEFVRGRSLEQVLKDHGPLGPREAALIGIDLCRALSALHRAGVVHRDVKAQNAMREEGGRILLMDLGAGTEVTGEHDARRDTIAGTPLYMAPELFRGEPATEGSDIFSLGVLLYHLVTGAFPIEAASWDDLCGKHLRRETTLLRDRRSDLPDAFVKVVERATAWESKERFATAGAMEQALSFALGTESGSLGAQDQMRNGESGSQRRRRSRFTLASVGAVAAVLAVAALLLFTTTTRRSKQGTSDSAARPVQVVPSYTVDAVLYRTPANSGERERLEPGARLSLGDRLNLEFKASRSLHVYVIDEDDAGHAYSLFPLPGLTPGNPLPSGVSLVLPGSRAGKQVSWIVNSPGGHEHLMILASPTRLSEFEASMTGLARPGEDAVPVPETAKLLLRGIGGLADSPSANSPKSAGPLFEMAQELASRSEVVSGVWLRRVELQSPRPR